MVRRVRLTLRQLEIFAGVVRCGTTAAAGDAVSLSQSATSAALKELEHALGAPLFDRVGKRLLVNDRGRALLPAVLAVLDGARSIEIAFGAGGDAAPDLRLFASTTIGNYVLPRVLAGYRRTRADASLQLRIGNTLDVVTAVRQFTSDLGFIEGPCHASDVTVIPWIEDRLVIVAAPTHALARESLLCPLNASQLMAAPWLLREPGSGTREAVELALLPHLAGMEASLTLGSSEAIKNAVAEGLGVSCLSRAVVRDLVSAGRLMVLDTRLPPLTRWFSLIHPRRKILSESLRGFMRHCVDSEAG